MIDFKRPKKEDYDFNDNIEGVRYAKDMYDYADKLEEQLRLYNVSNCNAKKDPNIENTILFLSRKDGLTDVYDNSGCLGKGLDTDGINKLNL